LWREKRPQVGKKMGRIWTHIRPSRSLIKLMMIRLKWSRMRSRTHLKWGRIKKLRFHVLVSRWEI
jgi:hypothetical protein